MQKAADPPPPPAAAAAQNVSTATKVRCSTLPVSPAEAAHALPLGPHLLGPEAKATWCQLAQSSTPSPPILHHSGSG